MTNTQKFTLTDDDLDLLLDSLLALEANCDDDIARERDEEFPDARTIDDLSEKAHRCTRLVETVGRELDTRKGRA